MTPLSSTAVTAALVLFVTSAIEAQPGSGPLFATSDLCMACHNNITTPAGDDVSFGFQWRPTMMANAARDPYWQAAVRRETLDHPEYVTAIEHECAACHMPMARYEAKIAGVRAPVFGQLPTLGLTAATAQLAADGVGCTVCHRMTDDPTLGRREGFTAGFTIDSSANRHLFGPFTPPAGNVALMRSAVGFTPTESDHLAKSEVCATCHTLFTHALGVTGGELPEQVPYLEWQHSTYRNSKSCQDCHMPAAPEGTPVSSVLSEPRNQVATHAFAGGNFLMPRILAAHRSELRVTALPQELASASQRAVEHLEHMAADIRIENATRAEARLSFEVLVSNRAGHKLPTGYPSRRVWVHAVVRDRAGTIVLESGALEPNGSIRGNDNDADATRYEPHHREITSCEAVQIYEPILGDEHGRVTTGLLTASQYLKDNRLLPAGFAKSSASAYVAVHGDARADDDFVAGGDRIRYVADVSGAVGPFTVEVALVYQPVAYRWAQNLSSPPSTESERFIAYYNGAASASAVVLAHASTRYE